MNRQRISAGSENEQSELVMNKFLILAVGAFLLFACTRNPFKVDLSETHVDFKYDRFSDDLFAIKDDPASKLPALEAKYPDVLPLFTSEVITIGLPGDSGFTDILQSFVQDTLMNAVKKQVDTQIDQNKLKTELEKSFQYFHYYFPDKIVPEVFGCVSGFNQSIIMTDKLMGIGLDKYLGRDCEYYPQLGVPKYERLNMHPDKIVPDAMYAWASTEFPFQGYGPHLIDRMIYEGKLLYFLDALLPDTPDTLKIGYTKQQLDFCYTKEEAMWTYLIQYKLLFSTERMDVKRYVDESPYTSSFTEKSPGRTGAWIGWQIVKTYMKKHPEVKIPELMEDKDTKKILNSSGYQPGQ